MSSTLKQAGVLALVICGGCSWIFMERPPDRPQMGMPVHCTATKGWVAWDGLFVAADLLAVVANVASRSDVSDGTALNIVVGVNALDAALHLSSAFSGSEWADRCKQLRAEYERPTPMAAAQVRAVRATSDKTDRRTVYGEKPLHCAPTTPDVGECFLDEQACARSLEASGATACEAKQAGSCFNATKLLDGSKATVCAVSIKDCETRRATYTANPDFRVTACGIYRQDER